MESSLGQAKSGGSSQLIRSTFRCQRCCVRLALDGSLRSLDRESAQAMVESFRSRQIVMSDASAEQQQQQQQQQQQLTGMLNSSCDSDSSSQDFMLLTEAGGGPQQSGPASISQNLSSRLSVFERLFEFLNANCAADHPLCADCADSLMQLQADRVKQLEDELHCMTRYLEHLNRQEVDKTGGGVGEDAATASAGSDRQLLSELEAEEAELRSQLEAAAAELATIRVEADSEEARKAALEAEHGQLQCAYSELKRQLFVLEDQLTACRSQQTYAEAELNRLQNTSVLGAAFHIWYDANLASICGFRMGKPPGGQIDWAEVNAGWGQCALLLQAVAARLGFASSAYAVVPCASQSEMRVFANGRSLPLYSSQGRLFQDTAFDAAMSAYLTCLGELLTFVRDRYGKSLAPYHVLPPRDIEDSLAATKDRYSIVRAGNKDDRWTMALRLLLLDLKMIITWMSTEPELPAKAAAAAAAAAANILPTGK